MHINRTSLLLLYRSGCSTYLEYGAEYILDMGTVYQIIAPTTARECERLCSSNSLCRGHAYRTSHQDCGLFISGTESFWGGCLACSAAAKQCPAGRVWLLSCIIFRRNLNHTQTAAVAQSVRTFASQEEGWVLESQPRRIVNSSKQVVTAPLQNAQQ